MQTPSSQDLKIKIRIPSAGALAASNSPRKVSSLMKIKANSPLEAKTQEVGLMKEKVPSREGSPPVDNMGFVGKSPRKLVRRGSVDSLSPLIPEIEEAPAPTSSSGLSH
eukprot:CAMPEP_0196596772 /NCGR_PEP_ID=MMETSP1081-20130531/87814_1 /TAXON_ID=36882 /ORGANISM="Pyramimonas amylifera, Strain CCMP720" /LENGTH=108 /DNA_ID=CAMNT_0041921915 /DNA_START=1 /DNA_END=324 /DNA_ORIENTATION=+